MRSISVETSGPAPEGAQEHAGLLVQHAAQVGAALVDVGGQFLGLRRHAARDLGAHAEQQALDLAGILLQRSGHAGRDGGERTLGLAGAALDRTTHFAGDGADLARRLVGAGAQRFGGGRRKLRQRTPSSPAFCFMFAAIPEEAPVSERSASTALVRTASMAAEETLPIECSASCAVERNSLRRRREQVGERLLDALRAVADRLGHGRREARQCTLNLGRIPGAAGCWHWRRRRQESAPRPRHPA